MNNKGAELSINTLIIVILAVIALVVIIFIFSGAMRGFASSLFAKLKNALGLLNSTEITK